MELTLAAIFEECKCEWANCKRNSVAYKIYRSTQKNKLFSQNVSNNVVFYMDTRLLHKLPLLKHNDL